MAPITTPPVEIQALRGVTDMYEKWVSELTHGLRDQDGLVDMIEHLTEARDHALKRVKQFEGDNATLSDEALSLRESVEDLRKRESTMLREKKRVERQAGALYQQIEALQEELTRVRGDLAQAATGLGAAHGESDAQATKVEELRVRLVHTTQDLETAREHLAERDDEIRILNSKLKDAQKLQEQKSALSAAAEQEIKELKDKLNHANSSKTRSEQRNEANRQKAVDAERVAREKVKEVESVLLARDKELEKAKEDLAQARDTLARRADLAKQKDKQHTDQVESLATEKERLDKQLDAMIAKATDAEARASSLQSQLDSAGGDATVMQRQVMDSMRESIKIAAGGVRIALDKLVDQDGDYELDATDPIVEKLRVAQAALAGDLDEQDEE